MDWLAGGFELLGVAAPNWMLVVAGGLLLYIAVLMIAQRCNAR